MSFFAKARKETRESRYGGSILLTFLGHLPCVWLESGASRIGANPFLWLFGWRMGGLGWLQGGIFLSDARWTRPSKSGERSRSSRVGSHQTLNSFNQTLNGAALCLILQPNTTMGWLRPQNQKCNQTLNGLAPFQKLGWIQPNPPNPQHTVGNSFRNGRTAYVSTGSFANWPSDLEFSGPVGRSGLQYVLESF